MPNTPHQVNARRTAIMAVFLLLACELAGAPPLGSVHADPIPERCLGYGTLQSISKTDWQAGLGSWTAGRLSVANPATFDSTDWAVAGNLPDGRSGSAAFAPNLVLGDCATDNETGVLTLQSPSITIPGGVAVPRISIDHWFQTELGWDGGQFKIKVGGGGSPFNTIPASAIEMVPYNEILEPPLDEYLEVWNSNPFAGLAAFSGTHDGQPTGDWVQTRINLRGIASAGSSIQLRIDFGLDECTVAEQVPAPVGWYVDEVEVYNCAAELPPSNCGNGVINSGEQCDDGNNFIGDGCSNTCQVESGWQCAAPTPPGTVPDPGFEAGRPNPFWDEFSTNGLGSPICDVATCGLGQGSGPYQGTYWVWLGGVQLPDQEGSVSQSVVIPTYVTNLRFELEIPRCDSPADYVEVLIDDNREFLVTGASPLCGKAGYTTQTVDISEYADGGSHVIEFHSETFANNGAQSNFFIDAVALPSNPSACRRVGTSLTLIKDVINDDGGTAPRFAWTLAAAGPSPFSAPGPVAWGGTPFQAGTYDLSESGGPSTYTASAWVCKGGTTVDGNTVSVAPDQAVTCTITNDDRAPTLTLVNTISNDNGGPVSDPNAFDLRIDGFQVGHNVPNPVEIGDHQVSAGSLPGYQTSVWGGACDPDGSVTLALGQNATCTISNDDIPATLTVFKTIVNDDDGTQTNPNAFGLRVDGAGVQHGVAIAVDAGNHTVSEVGLPGYIAGTWGGDCSANGAITLDLDEDATCSITNNDLDRTRLTLVKQVINDSGGGATAAAWTLSAFGPTSFNGAGPSVSSSQGIPPGTYHLFQSTSQAGYETGTWICVGGNQVDGDTVTLAVDQSVTCTNTSSDIPAQLTVLKNIVNDHGGTATNPDAFGLRLDGNAILHNVPNVLSAGNHTASEVGLPGYQAGNWGGDCNPDGTITLALAESAICTITNNDIPASLTVLKTIVNDNGGTITNKNAFGLRIDGGSALHGVAKAVSAGNHTVSEVGQPGYMAGAWGGDCTPNGTIVLALGQAATCTITNNDIAPTIKLVKNIINDSGGTINDPNAFGLKVDGNPVLHNAVNVVNAGVHVASETGLPGYVASVWGGDCASNGSITLGLAEEAICTITNNDSDRARLTLAKNLFNNYGGTATGASWTLSAAGPTAFSDVGPIVTSGSGLLPGTYDLSESGPAGYAASAWTCSGGTQVDSDTVNVALDQTVLCNITNYDIAPTLTLVNTVINDDGGTATANEFGLKINGNPATNNVPATLGSGNHSASADGLTGYLQSTWGGDCQPDGSITLSVGEQATCTVTHDDIAPTLKLVKTITNDHGGTVMDPDAFGLRIDGQPVLHNAVNSVTTGNHTVSEVGLEGYIPGTWGGDCDPGGTITLVAGQEAECTLTNDDSDATSLTLRKIVINDNGGTAAASAWTLNAAGETGFTGSGPIVSSETGFVAGTYDLSETNGPAGYTASAWSCDGGTQNDDDTVTLALDEVVTCTITNDDLDNTSLTLVKEVVNDNGGSAQPSAWTLSAIGPRQFSGSGPIVASGQDFSAGTYDLSESVGPAGYSASAWACTGGSQNGNQVTVALGQAATCTITNNDNAPSLTLNKVVTNNNGGTALPSAWTLTATGPTPLSGPGAAGSTDVQSGPSFDAGTYTLNESAGPAGYTASAWVCTGGSQNGNQITVGLGQSATCTITNNDNPPSLTLNKVVTNNNGGTALPSAWTLSAAGPTPLSGPGAAGSTDVQSGSSFAAGTYTLSESAGPAGYSASAWVCTGGSQNGNQITLTLGQAATCTITNDDNAPSLTLNKVVTNDNGGTALPSAWTLTAAGPTPLSGPGAAGSADVQSGPSFAAGTYTLSESAGPTGYTASAWNCTGGSQNGNQITLTLGQAATCTISSNDNAPGLTLVKQVTNDNGGTAMPTSWTLTATGPTGFTGPGPSVSNGANFQGGTYTLSESGPGGYTASAWVCTGGGQNGNQITLSLGQSATCTITNNDLAPSLTLNKVVVNDNGGTALPSAWTLSASGGPTPISGPGAAGSTDVQSGPSFDAGTYTLSESAGPAGYSASTWVCTGGSQSGNQITLTLGQSATCTITNNDQPPSLTLDKVVVNDNGGTALPSAWTISASGGPTPISGLGAAGNTDVQSGPSFDAGTYTLGESAGPAGYGASAWSCTGGSQNGSQITVGLGQAVTCTITNNDSAPSLTLNKVVTNDNGGTALPSAWTLSAAGPTPLSGPGAAGSTDVQSGPSFAAGTYTLSESAGPAGYTASAWSCTGGSQNGNQITLSLGQSAICTITNDDTSATSLTLVKQVTNDNGGTAPASGWMLSATGPTGFSGAGPSIASGSGFAAGTYTLSESGGPAGYSASSWVCNGGSQNGNQITLSLGQAATCTITNNDNAPSLTLNKVVTNDNGGTALPSAWTLSAAGPTPLSGPGAAGSTDVQSGPSFTAGTYTLSESAGPAGYSASAWVCTGGSQNGNQITLTVGQAATCTITNNDNAPSLTLNKVVTNDNGGTALPSAWTLSAAGPTPISGPGAAGSTDVQSGASFAAGTYTLSESVGPAGYTASAWNCTGGSQNGNQITLTLGQAATCTITNNDNAPSLTLNKVVTNDNGGTALPSAWTLSAAGPTPLSGPGAAGSTDVQSGPSFAAGTYTLSESVGPAGYTASAWSCTGGSQTGNQITLTLGQSATCTITNNDNAPSLTLNKVVTNDNGGTALPSAWTLSAAGPTPLSGPGAAGSTDVQSGPSFAAGTYTLSESTGPAGYSASAWVCTGGSQAGNQITLTLGQAATCTITNNDNAPSLTLNKVVTNNNGGTAQPSAWTLSAAGPTPLSGPGAAGSTDVQSGPSFAAGTYTLSESGPGGYTASAWSCTGGNQNGNQITLTLGQSATCTITNNDQPPSLTLDKVVINNNGGTALPSAWTLSAAGPTPLSGPGAAGNTDVQSGPSFAAGTYTLSESTGPAGYTASAWNCTGGSQNGNQITLTLGQSATCSITNDDVGPGLTLNKVVTNDNGGTAPPSAWTLTATGPSVFSGPGPTVASGAGFVAGTYTLSESTGPAGYTASAWSCTGGSQNGNQITLTTGQAATCTITSNDNAPSLTLNKVVTNNNGGTALPSAWTLTAAGPTPLSGPGAAGSNDVQSGPSFDAGTYTLSESAGPAGYSASAWSCTGGSQNGNQITLALGQAATCTITNNDNAPSLTLNKVVTNDNGGTALPSAWTLTATGPTGFSGAGPSVSNGASFDAGTYNLSESDGPAGYSASAWVCLGGSQVDTDTITLALGQAATCTITNDDQAIGEVIFEDGFE
ncbi:MAG: DUF4215 domain-containing protein [Lysobacterales bacterium]